jgi:hypothetical protein
MWGIVAAGAVICAAITYFVKDYMLILSTAISGSYLSALGIGFIAGGFPSIFEIYDIIQSKGQVRIILIYNLIAANDRLFLFRRNSTFLYSWDCSTVLH